MDSCHKEGVRVSKLAPAKGISSSASNPEHPPRHIKVIRKWTLCDNEINGGTNSKMSEQSKSRLCSRSKQEIALMEGCACK
eukprot:gene24915-biopygen10297